MASDQPLTPAPGVRPPIDRAAALAEGAPKVPRRVVVIGVLVAAALALGGAALERVASSAGLNPSAAPTTTTVPRVATELHASTAALLDIVGLRPRAAWPFRLTDQSGRAVTPATLRGDVVVLSFFDADCKDACPVLAQEIRRADADLGPRRHHVEFVTINADPLQTGTVPVPPVVSSSGLGQLSNWRFLTGPLRTLDPIWRQYGVAIDVYTKTGRVAHNDVMYFLDPSGRLRLRATPVANEGTIGAYSLPGAVIARSAAGIAAYAAGLLGPTR